MVFYTGLARLARDAGLVVREVNGWKSRTLGTRPNGMAGARGCLWHHTATSASAVKARNNPTLNYMVNGLGYPLANYGLAWDGSIDVIAAGAAAHAGKGRYGSRVPRDRGNDYLLGVEVEGTTGLTWSDAQLESAARLGHAMNKEWGSSFLQIGHNEYAPGRKIDPTGIPGGMPALRKAISRGYWKIKNWKPGGKVSTGTSSSTTKSKSSSSSSSATIGQARTNRDKVPVHSHRDSSGDKQVDTLHKKGYRVNIVENPKGGWTRIRNSKGPGGNGWVASAHLEGDSSPKAKGTTGSSSAYPNKALPLTDSHTTASHNAWVYLMRHAVNRTDRNLTINIQRWLRDLNYYKGAVDGAFGPRTVRAMQNFLKDRNFYSGVIDGVRGPMTIRGEINYLNSQRKYLT